MRVLSLFDGIATGRLALEMAGVPVDLYIASEIDKDAKAVARANWPDMIHIGPVENVTAPAAQNRPRAYWSNIADLSPLSSGGGSRWTPSSTAASM